MRTNARKAALVSGAKQYSTGAPCKYGHLSPRTTTNGECVECARLRAAAKYKADPAASVASVRRWQCAHAEQVKAAKRQEYERNRDYYCSKAAAQRAADPANHLALLRAWKARNKDKNRHYCSKRHAGKLQRTPAWADMAAIGRFYAECPPGHHVDHVIPLRGRLVSGLHVLNNLQYLPNIENLRKKNKFDPWTFEA